MGLTGVGKSSLINYLAGETVADAGITSGTGGLTRGIHKYPININGQHCMVSDTEGLESSHSKFWQNLMEKELLATDANKPFLIGIILLSIVLVRMADESKILKLTCSDS